MGQSKIVCEIDLTRERIDKRGLYASPGLPEFWRFDGERMRAYALRRGEYVEVENSIAFSWLRMAELERFLKMPPGCEREGKRPRVPASRTSG